ncbi:sentrin-specific protease 7-like [Echinops telfairi]|uniref:Sentrin-specific protease 7-like n=1 Tax=Echinops telfairi TaxID=9371 RepID=A0AC55CPP3_ECHTE|nr:sentrin-specific protease 7-like [Echinops telfairi]
MLKAKPESIRVQSSLSKLRSSERWNLPLQEWKRSLRNKVISLDRKSKKGVPGRPVTSKAPSDRQLKVMLTNVLWTDLGRKFRKSLPRSDANSCDVHKEHSASLPSTAADHREPGHKLELLNQSRPVSERSSPSSKTANNKSAKQAAHTKKQRDGDDGISHVIPDTQPKGL